MHPGRPANTALWITLIAGQRDFREEALLQKQLLPQHGVRNLLNLDLSSCHQRLWSRLYPLGPWKLWTHRTSSEIREACEAWKDWKDMNRLNVSKCVKDCQSTFMLGRKVLGPMLPPTLPLVSVQGQWRNRWGTDEEQYGTVQIRNLLGIFRHHLAFHPEQIWTNDRTSQI